MKKVLVLLLIVLVGGTAYAQRGVISDWFVEVQKPNVSEVAFEDVDQATDEVEQPENEGSEQEPLTDPVVEPTAESESTLEPEAESEPESDPEAVVSTHPVEFNLAIPFTSQAPHSNWDEPYQELCEEASALMAAAYIRGDAAGKISPDTADAELLKLVDFENQLFGFYKDTTAEETALLIESYYHLTADLLENPTIEQIKSAIVAGYPVIVPAAGQQLGNPNFTGLGPPYHMFVVKGYTKDGFITNEPGTRLGADYFYTYETVMTAMHDWNGGDVANGAKVVIIVKP